MACENELSVISITVDGFVATLHRTFEHSQQTVWSMLTDPGHLVDWLAPGEIELRKGGRAQLNFVDSGIVIDSIVTAFEAPHLLEYSWSNPREPLRPIRWETRPQGQLTALTLTLTCPLDDVIARSCAGWEAHLMMLMAALEGVPIKFPFDFFQQSRKEYDQQVAELQCRGREK